MKINVPQLDDGVTVKGEVVHVHVVSPELTAVLALLGFGLLALAAVLADNGSKVAGRKGGRRGY